MAEATDSHHENVDKRFEMAANGPVLLDLITVPFLTLITDKKDLLRNYKTAQLLIASALRKTDIQGVERSARNHQNEAKYSSLEDSQFKGVIGLLTLCGQTLFAIRNAQTFKPAQEESTN